MTQPSFTQPRFFEQKLRNGKAAFGVFIAVILLLMTAMCFLLFAPSKKAAATSKGSYERRIVSVRVTQDDSLWKIAERFYCEEKESVMEMVAGIKATNHLSNDTIYPDTYLVVQYFVKAN